MIRADKFLISQRPYAIDLDSYTVTELHKGDEWYSRYRVKVTAVWFRRRHGRTVAAIGTISNSFNSPPVGVDAFLAGHDDSRHAGDCQGRWDGERYWGAQQPEVIQEHLELLQPMLAGYPAIPERFDGWWRFS